jgi:hypothetical protein
MPDLTNDPIGSNHRRALDNFSRFGTRKLVWYVITVYGLDDATMEVIYGLDGQPLTGEQDYDAAGDDYPPEWIEQPGSILEAIQRGVQLIAEPYAYGDWEDYNEEPDYNNITIIAMVASETVDDKHDQDNSPVPVNPNSYTLETAILDAISGFANDGVNVNRAYMYGDYIDQGSSALARVRGGTEESRARWAARLAKGKNAVKRK